MLESLQTEIVLALSGAWKYTACEVLEKEMHILPILVKLHEVAMNHRCRSYYSKEYALMHEIRYGPRGGLPRKSWGKSKFILETHPYHQLGLLTEQRLKELQRHSRPPGRSWRNVR
jgi:hypothetical protein